MDLGKKGKNMYIVKTLLHTPACTSGSRVVSAGSGRIECVCDFSTLCPRKEGVRGGLCGGHREHIVPMVLLQCKPGLSLCFSLSLELTLLHMQKNSFLLGFSLATVEP